MDDEPFEDFRLACSELDTLALEGFYGEEQKQLTIKRDSMDVDTYLYTQIESWALDNSLCGRQKTNEMILTFLKIYTKALQNGGQEAVDTLNAFWRGTKENPELECLSAATESSRLAIEYKNLVHSYKGKNLTYYQLKELVSKLINSYSKGIEFIGKIIGICICLAKIGNKEPYDLLETQSKTVAQKINEFNEITDNQYNNLTSLINREIRNADSHLSVNYDRNKNQIVLKIIRKNKSSKIRYNIQDMIKNIYPRNGWIIQGFDYSGMLFCLVKNKDLYQKAVKIIFDV